MKVKSVYSLILFIAFFVNPFLTYSQNKQISFDYLTADDGLSSNFVQCIFRDSKDYMWFGTNDQGLNKFNGYKVTVYKRNADKPGSISNNSITCIYEDSAKNVWIGTISGLNLYRSETDSFTVFRNDSKDINSLASDWIYDLIEDDNGNLWVAAGANGGLNKWIPETNHFIRYPMPDSINPGYDYKNSLTSVKKDSHGIFWIVDFGRGIYSFNPETYKYTYYTDTFNELSGHSHKKLCIDDQDVIWIVSYEDGFSSFDTSTHKFKHFGKDIGLVGSETRVLTDVIQEDVNHILIGADQGGVSRFNKITGTFESITEEDANSTGFNSQGIRSLYIDKEKILWVGTSRGGLNYYNPKENKFKLIKHSGTDHFTSLRNIIGWLYEDSKGLIWIGTDGGGVDVYNPQTGSFKNYRNNPSDPNSISGDVIRCIVEDKDHSFWIGTWDSGLDRFDPKTRKFYHYFPGKDSASISSNAIWNMKIDQNDDIWIAPFFGGIDLFNRRKGVFKRIRANSDIPGSISHNLVWSIVQDQQYNIWVCTNDGINLYNKQTNTFRVYNQFPDNAIRTFCRDSEGKLWAGSMTAGLFLFDMDGNVIKTYNETSGLADNTIEAIVEDNNGDLWISTNNGLSHFIQKTQQFRNYYKEDGLQGNIFYELSALKTRSGEIYFGGYNGFNAFYPDSLKDNDYIPKVYITDFKIFNKSVTLGSPESILSKQISETTEITLSREHSVISFEFAAINYTNPEKNSYAYIMEGFDKEWNYVGNKMDATYTHLDPGHYVFRVKASNNDGVWNEVGTSIIVTIKPAFWQTWIFKFSVILFVIAGFILIYKIRLAQIRKQKEVLSRLVSERTKELEETNKLLKETNRLLAERQQETEEQAKKLKLQNEVLKERKLKLNNTLKELQQAQMQLLQSEKMASLGILTAGVAHEINNPLNFIRTGLDAMETTIEDEEIKSETLSTIVKHMNIGVDRVSAIVRSLKTFSRKDSHTTKKCDIHEIIDNSLLILNHELKHKCEVKKNYTTEKFTLIANEENLHQVFINLIMNSVHAIKEKGKILITTKIVLNMLEITLVDNGVGISKDVQNQIFDPFFTTKDPGKGVGLGLSIVYKIIAEHQGEIKFSSKEKKYTRVKVYLPISE